MKKRNNFFVKFLSVFLIASGFLLASCSNGLLSFGNENQNKESGSIKICLGLKSIDGDEELGARTVMATETDNKDPSSLSEIFLYAKVSSGTGILGESSTLLATWENYDQICLHPYSKNIAAGKYNFMLTAKNYGATMTQTISGVSISSGSQAVLNFTSLAPSSSGEQSGGIEVKLNCDTYYNVDSDFKKYVYSYPTHPVISISLDSSIIVTKDSSTSSISKKTDEAGNTYAISDREITFISSPVSAGFHIVQFTFTANDGSVLVYPVPVYVQTGYLSRQTLTPFSTSKVSQAPTATSHTVTYNSNTTSSETATQTFYEGSSIADAEALGFSSGSTKRFKSWNTKSNGTGTSYAAGDSPNLSSDITLYAQWGNFKKVTYLINVDGKTDSYVQCYESTSSLFTSETAFPDYNSSSKTFCGWDTKSDGSGRRYDKNDSPYLTQDIVLYAQWCGEKNSSLGYMVKNEKEWNAVMAAPFAVSGNMITVDVYVSSYSSTPLKVSYNLTGGKSFGGKLSGYGSISGLSGPLFNTVDEAAEVSGLTVYAPVCKTNYGTIKNVTAQGFSLKGSYGYECLGGICYENQGTINGCDVKSCTVDGETNGIEYVGGICGKNNGSITGSGTVDVTLKGYENYGYVTGWNKTNAVNSSSSSNPISTSITVSKLENIVILNKTNEALEHNYTRTYDSFTLNGCTKVHFVMKDSSGGSNTNKETLKLYDSADNLVKTFVSSGTPNVDTYIYLNKGTYKLKRTNSNLNYTSYLNIKVER